MIEVDYRIIDIGSTYTKQRLISNCNLIASCQSPTTIDNVFDGILKGKDKFIKDIGENDFVAKNTLASSSAGGGLRMVAMGYMARVTSKAAKEVAMNSGAKILEILSHNDSNEYRLEILREIDPDIILLAGGTDYGDESSIIENAGIIIKSKVKSFVVVAGNISAQDEISEILTSGDIGYKIVPNIMPNIHTLEVDKAREAIHKEFIKQIIKAKGLNEILNVISNDIIIPTPGAVLRGAELLAKGTMQEDGLGEIVVIDLGGATTDIHSIMPMFEKLSNEELGLIVSNDKQISYRTVEGNIGLRISATGILSYINPKGYLAKKSLESKDDLKRFIEYCRSLEKDPERLPKTEYESTFDSIIAEACVEIAIKRHAGYISKTADPVLGIVPGMPVGRDLRRVKKIVAVGGIFAHSSIERSKEIVKNALENRGVSLLPENFEIIIDKSYLLYAVGVIDSVDKEYAFQILKSNFYGRE